LVLADEGDEGLLVTGPQPFQQSDFVNALLAAAGQRTPLHYCIRGAKPREISIFLVTVLRAVEL
jgi:hypothetical protein